MKNNEDRCLEDNGKKNKVIVMMMKEIDKNIKLKKIKNIICKMDNN
jgi:hypothetical protein